MMMRTDSQPFSNRGLMVLVGMVSLHSQAVPLSNSLNRPDSPTDGGVLVEWI
jgi:hypothetical protein